MELIDSISQVMIVVMGISAIFMVAKKNRWGFVVGLVHQPFWFFIALYNAQWGILIVTVGYTVSWMLGIYEWFIKKPPLSPALAKKVARKGVLTQYF